MSNPVSEEHLAFLQLSAERDPARVGDCPKCGASWVWQTPKFRAADGVYSETAYPDPDTAYMECENCGATWGES